MDFCGKFVKIGEKKVPTNPLFLDYHLRAIMASSMPPPPPPPPGIANEEQNCYLNSVLQVLRASEYVQGKRMRPSADNTGEQLLTCAACNKALPRTRSRKTCCAMRLVENHLDDEGEKNGRGGIAIRADAILANLGLIAPGLARGRQEDAHEFLRKLIQAMKDSYPSAQKHAYPFSIFAGAEQSTIKCTLCKVKQFFKRFEISRIVLLRLAYFR